MPRTAEEEPLHKHTLFLYKGDFDRMRNFYPDMPPAKAIRMLVRSHLNQREALVRTKVPTDVEVKL
jgi:hypothetical protein